MFRLESYITPLVMNYIDRYVKLKSEDFQMSLWGGAAVLNQLDLRLEAIQTALNLPIQLTNGHISELKIQVPWTKLGFEPVVVTIKTMECVLSLRNTETSSETSSTVDSSLSVKTARKTKKPQSQNPDIPPGYIQSLLNRIVNNVNIVVENLILKFVEEDIVFSMNIKTMEIFSVNAEWKRAFADLSAPDFVLRRLIEFTDLTVCLDKVNLTDGKIEVYQDPLIYRCSLTTRVHTKYDNLHSSMPSTTKIHTMCEELNLSLTDTQLPMFARLLELMLAIYYGDIELSSNKPTQDEQPDSPQMKNMEEVSPTPEASEKVGWASWAWSMVPQVLPEEDEDSTGSSSEDLESVSKPSPPVFDISFYNRKATLTIKLSRYMHSKSVKASGAKVLFEPLAELKTEGMALEILVKGMIFLDVQFGMTKATISGVGDCICGVAATKSSQATLILEGGCGESKQSLHYLTGCLFDKSRHHSAISTHIFDYERHSARYKESWAVERFGALWINYLWIEEPPPTLTIDPSNDSNIQPDFVDESTHMKFWFHQVVLNYNSDTKHRLDKLLFCLSDHTYEPYAKRTPEVVDPTRPTLTTQQIKALESFIPVKDLHLAFLRCRINIYSASHPDIDVTLPKTSRGKKVRPLPSLCGLKLSAERLDMQTISPMYPRRLVKLISTLPEPSGNLIYHCQYHKNIKVMSLMLELMNYGEKTDSLTILRPMSAAYYNNYLALPVYWTGHNIERSSSLYEVPEVSVHFSHPQLKAVFSICMSWQQPGYTKPLHDSSIIPDAFSASGNFPLIDLSLSRFEMKQSDGNRFNAAFANLGSISISIITKEGEDQKVSTMLQAPADTSVISEGQLFRSSKPIKDSSDDFLCLTYQLPNTDSSPFGQEKAVFLCTMQGFTATADPILVDWLLYQEKTNPENVVPPTASLGVGSSLPHHLSDITLRSENTTTSTSVNERKALKPSINAKTEPTTKTHEESSKGMWLDYLPTLHLLSQSLSVNVKIRSGCILIPSKTLTSLLDNCEHNMAKQWRDLGYSGSLPNSLVICLPSVSGVSQNVTLSAPVEDLPIRFKAGTLALPIIVKVEAFSMYTYINRECSNLLEPVSCTSTITMNSGHCPLSNKPLSSLSLSVHHSISHVSVNFYNEQVELMVELILGWLRLLPVAIRLKGGAASAHKSSFTAPYVENYSVNSSQPSLVSQYSRDNVSYMDPVDSELSHKFELEHEDTVSTPTTYFFRTEAKLAHLSLNLFFKQQGYKYECLQGMAEEGSACVDVYRDYVKFQAKIWSIELLHGFYDQRCGEFVAGANQGILLSSSRRFINLETMNSAKQNRDISPMLKEQPREGIVSIIYTRASQSSLKRRDVESAGAISTRSRDGYITELCIDMARCDIVCHLPAITNVLQMLLSDCLPSLESIAGVFKATKEVGDSGLKGRHTPWLHSQTLPLIHLTVGETRVLFPVEGVPAHLHDVMLITVQSVQLTPQAENPLSRLVLDNDLYKKNSHKMSTPGSLVEDRQLQMDIIGLSLLAGTYAEMKLEDKGLCPSSFENPAFEWNKIAKSTDVSAARLYPIVSGVQLNLQVAPAIVFEERMICTHSAEVNVRSDINISLTDLHMSLILDLAQQIHSSLAVVLASIKVTPTSNKVTVKKTSAKEQRDTTLIGHYVSMVYPINLLMTACDISVTLIGGGGLHPVLAAVFSQPHTIVCTKPKSERLEMSCYDVKVKAASKSEVRAGRELVLAADAIFGLTLVETTQGMPDPKTGIYPGVFTFKVTKYLDKPEVSIANERPVHIALPLKELPQLLAALADLLPTSQPSSQEDSAVSQPMDKPSTTPAMTSYLGSAATKGYALLPLHSIILSGSECLLKLECRDGVIVQAAVASIYGQVSVATFPDHEQLDISLSFSCADADLTVGSSQLLSKPLGPLSLIASLDMTLSPSHPPTSICTVSSSILPLQLGNKSLEIGIKAAEELIALSSFQVKSGRREKTANKSCSSSSPSGGKIEYKDDLRLGSFKYLLDKEQSIPRPNTVMFYSDRDYSTLTWSYAEPRVLSNIHINPMPFDYPTDPKTTFHCLDVQIHCCLELWSTSRQKYKQYSTFSISEQFGTSVALPTLNSQLCMPARTWRITINYYIDRRYAGDYSFEHVFAMVSPAVLVAAMRVDSVYMPSLVPTMQLSLSIDQIRLSVINQYSASDSYGSLGKLSPFTLDENDMVDHEMFCILLNDMSVESSFGNLDEEKSVKGILSFSLLAKYVDYRHVVWRKFLEVSGFNLIAELKDGLSKPRALTFSNDVKHVETILTQSLMSSLLSLHHVWGKADGQHPLTGLYAICNNTHGSIFIKQVRCEDDSAVCIAAGRAHCFCWSRYGDLRLQVALEELPHHWSTPFELDNSGQAVSTIATPNGSAGFNPVHLFINVERVTSIHNLITISGSICVSSRLSATKLDVRVSDSPSNHRHLKISPEHSFGSFAVSSDMEMELRVRPSADESSTYSGGVMINSAARSHPISIELIKVGGEGLGEVCALQRLFTRNCHGATQYCVEIVPMYCVRSFLPHSLLLSILPSSHCRLEGSGRTTELLPVSGLRAHQISLQISETDTNNAVILPLSTDKFALFDDISDYPEGLSVLEVCKQSTHITSPPREPNHDWPSSSQIHVLSGKFQPLSLQKSQSLPTHNLSIHNAHADNIGLEITWSQHWSGSACMLMTIKPKFLFINQSTADLALVYGTEFCPIQSGETTFSPSGLNRSFSIGVYNRNKLFISDFIQLTAEEVTPRSFFLPDVAILFVDSYVYANIVILNEDDSIHQLRYIVVTSHIDNGVRIITLHDRFVLDNSLKQSLYVSDVVAPVSNKKVDLQLVQQNPRLLERESTLFMGSFKSSATNVITPSTAALFLSFSHSSSGPWSYPVQMPIESASRRIGVVIPALGSEKTQLCCLSTQLQNGVGYLMLTRAQTPCFILHNRCSFPLAYGQTLTRDSEDVLEAMSLLSSPPLVQPGQTVSYSFPTLTRQFPAHISPSDWPKLKLAGMNGHYGLEVWSEAIDLSEISAPKLIHIPDVCEAKVSFEVSQLNTSLYIEPIDRAKVDAQMIEKKNGEFHLIASPTVHLSETKQFTQESSTPPSPSPTQESSTPPSPCLIQESSTPSSLCLSITLLVDKASVLLLDEQSGIKSSEFLRLLVVGLGLQLSRPSLANDSLKLDLNLLDMTLYNQHVHSKQYDFPVVLFAQDPSVLNPSMDFLIKLAVVEEVSLLSITLTLDSLRPSSVRVASRPVSINIEDKFLQSFLSLIDSYVTLVAILPRKAVLPLSSLPLLVRHKAQCNVICLRELSIEKLELLVSIHASLKMFVATDQAPVTLARFHRLEVVSTREQLITDLAFHYGTGALYSVGWVLGSLELLFNPTGIVRSIYAGVSDLVYLPYYGLQNGPGAFITGVSQGMTSAVKNVTRGTLSSVTHFAQSVSRNMDRLSLDGEHAERQELMRRQKPLALSQGLRQGFSGLSLSFLGAIAGLADQPLQALWSEGASASHRATGLVTGVGKGLLGAIAKPISGTAEFISQTGQGLMSSVGLTNGNGQALKETYLLDGLYDYATFKYTWRFPLLSLHHGRTLFAIQARAVSGSEEEQTMLLLLPELIVVMDCKENVQQQAFALSQIDCQKSEDGEGRTYLQLLLTGHRRSSRAIVDCGQVTKHRVEDYVDSTTSGYQSGGIEPLSSSLNTISTLYHSFNDSLLLHEYSVPSTDLHYFLALFRYTKQQLNK